ncbi:unnamed protein product [Pleuronectes platessa]|uniref:Uncharacterized protein n=1 Tax=Pleuronectes platessa TaxID=8262 RepID=A0A9N7TWK4_PLEPL|nr:unnamed protein product [Pleuronectes platessa]
MERSCRRHLDVTRSLARSPSSWLCCQGYRTASCCIYRRSCRLLPLLPHVSPSSLPSSAVRHEVNTNSSAKHPRFIWLLRFSGCKKIRTLRHNG